MSRITAAAKQGQEGHLACVASLCAHLRPAPPPFVAMENASGEQVDLYIPRKWCVRCAAG